MKKLIAIAGILLLSACSSGDVSITMSNIDEYLGLDEYQYVDVREVTEIESTGKIQGFEVIPTSVLEASNYDFSDFDENKKILVMCRSGRRAGIIVELLNEAGYDAYNIGGIIDYNGTNLESMN